MYLSISIVIHKKKLTMKKKFITGLLAATIVTATSFAQSNKIAPAGAAEHNAIAHDNSINAAEVVYKNDISSRAARSFAREYKGIDPRWYKGDDWLAAYFTKNNTQVRVFYDSHGNYKYTMRSYQESALPKEVRHHVKSTLYDYSIFHINEISTPTGIIYFIKLEGKNSWKDIRIVDNEIESLQEYSKG